MPSLLKIQQAYIQGLERDREWLQREIYRLNDATQSLGIHTPADLFNVSTSVDIICGLRHRRVEIEGTLIKIKEVLDGVEHPEKEENGGA